MDHLPLFVWPKEEETLTSWLFRNAKSHRLKYVTFLYLLTNERVYYDRDIDSYITSQLNQTILDRFPIDEHELKQMMLSSFHGIVFENDLARRKLVSQMICILGSRHTRATRHTLTFCPKCLKETRYFKKQWRLTLVVGCPVHQNLLTDKCYKCHAPINYMRLGLNSDKLLKSDIINCWKCGSDITKARPQKMENHMQEYHSTVSNGIKLNPVPFCTDPLLFFRGIDTLSRMISSGFNQKKKFVAQGCKHFGINSNKLLRIRPEGIYQKSLRDRIEIVDFMARIIHEFPNAFDEIIASGKTYKSRLIAASTPSPFWIDERFYKM